MKFHLLLVSLFQCSLISASAAADAPSPNTPPSLLAEDSRLDRPVTVSKARIYLGELLADLSTQAHLSLSADGTKGPWDGIELTAIVKKRPLREVMEGLTQLLKHRRHLCAWRRSPGNGFMLGHSATFDAAAAATRHDLRERWATDVRTYHEISRLPDDLRATRASTRPELLPGSKIPHGKLDLFASLTPEQLNAVLRSTFVPIDSQNLSPRAREALALGESPSIPDPAIKPGFYVSWAEQDLAPILWLKGESGAAVNVVGGPGWDGHWLQNASEGWKGPLDPDAQDFLQRRVRMEKGLGTPVPKRTVAGWIKRVAEKQGLNTLTDQVYPRPRQNNVSAWMGSTPEQTMYAMALYAGSTWKKSGEIYLVRDKIAPVHLRGHLVSWSRIKSLRNSAQGNGEYLPFARLAELAELQPEQQGALSEEFPDASPGLLQNWGPLFRFYLYLDRSLQVRLTQPEGIPYRNAGLLARGALNEKVGDPRLLGQSVLEEHAREAMVYLSQQSAKEMPDNGPEREARKIVWEIRVPGGNPFQRKFIQKPRQPLQPE
jgi:hypothetical protein